jgi:hypothetical protein
MPSENPSYFSRLRRLFIGAPKQIKDPHIFHKLSLIPVLAWIGLGADGLSSSSYGPEEAYRALTTHTYLAPLIGVATALTVLIISYAYSRIIEHFPYGGGGYIVATHLLGEKAGVISGSALLVDYTLTITVSIVSCVDAFFSYLPLNFHPYKVPLACMFGVMLILLNIRGVKESVSALAPIFIVFIATHLLLFLDGFVTHTEQVAPLINEIGRGFKYDLSGIGFIGIIMLFLRAYSLGGGTYTGIEAVSNGLQIMREPRVQTGKRTMLYMAISLSITAGGLCILYALMSIRPVAGKTLNAVLANTLFASWPFGHWLAFITIFSEGALLLVAAQTGFVDGPRVMANMAVDLWFPRRFASLSERLTMQNGIVIMGAASIALMIYTHGSISALIVMYSINVFITFSLSQLGMSRFFIKHRGDDKKWKQHLTVHLIGFILCATILIITIIEKFVEGGWLTFLITAGVATSCYLIRNHYKNVHTQVSQIEKVLTGIPDKSHINSGPLDPQNPTAIQLVSGYSGFGIRTLMSIINNFPGTYKNIIFISVAVVDSGVFKGVKEVNTLEKSVQKDLRAYIDLARRLGYAAEYRMVIGTDVVESATHLCMDIVKEYAKSVVFCGQVTFDLQKFYHKMLHNETAFAIQRRLQSEGITTVILPIRTNV